MANKHRGEVDLQAGDKVYTLRLSINAIAEIETLLDMGMSEILGSVSDSKSFRVGNWRVFLWGALRDKHREQTLETAGDIMQEAGMNETISALGEAIKLAFPDMAETDEENPPSASPPKAG